MLVSIGTWLSDTGHWISKSLSASKDETHGCGISVSSKYLRIVGVRVVEENRSIFLRYAIEPDTDRINKYNDNIKSFRHCKTMSTTGLMTRNKLAGKRRVALKVEMEG